MQVRLAITKEIIKIRKEVFRNQAILDLASRGTIDDTSPAFVKLFLPMI